jgi:hypothetical protein
LEKYWKLCCFIAIINVLYSFWKNQPLGSWRDHQPNPVKGIKEGCVMSIKRLMKRIRFTGITLNIGFIGLNFAGGLSKVNIAKTVLK